MGDIAEMYVEAEIAGLEPADMDGADWADFFDSREDSGMPPNPWLLWHEVRSFIDWIDSEAEAQGCTPSEVIGMYFPKMKINSFVERALRHVAKQPDPDEVAQ